MRKQVLPRRRHIVARPRLTSLLSESDARVILLVAPAGYGKTTLAREWLGQGASGAWYSASPASTDVAALTAGIAAATSDDSTAVERVRHWLRHARSPEDEIEDIVSMLLHPDARDEAPSRVVVDDYQQLVGAERAEELIHRLAFSSGDQWLIASRTRPSWATERQLLYGEVQELGADALALTQDEALEVVKLSGGDPKRVSGLVELAEGWPAVIGLAARSGASDPPEPVVPEALHDFFAEELLESLDPALRSDLQTLAIVPASSSDLAVELVDDSKELLHEAHRIGFISLLRDQSYEMHPLLRSFLTRKALNSAGHQQRLHAIVDILASQARWDDALQVIDQCGELSSLPSVLARALDDLLGDGRVETVERWLERARAGRIDTPELDVADAEVALRRGDYLRAETLALRVDTKGRSDLSVRALICAGRSAHMADRYTQAREYFAKATELAVGQIHERDSVWGEMLATHQIAPGASRALLARFEELADESPETALRLFIGKYQLADAVGGLEPLVATGRSLLPIAERARDPFVRSSFFDALCRVFVLTGHYAEAQAMADMEIEEAKRYALRFVLPLALCGRALAQLGMRRFAHAWAHADEAEFLAREMGDVHTIFQAAVIRARICLARGDAEEALAWLRDVDQRRPGGGMWSEFLVFRVLALACAGSDEARMEDIADIANANVEARVGAAAAAAIIALDSGMSAENEMDRLASEVRETGCYDVLVTAYRARPVLLSELASRREKLPALFTTVANARDQAIARQAGLTVRDVEPRRDLTRRETQVLALVAEGKSNREIAELLVISEATAKLHVRHILNKLGARSRTEAALQASAKLDL